jgi:hypothetical protein
MKSVPSERKLLFFQQYSWYDLGSFRIFDYREIKEKRKGAPWCAFFG